MPSSVSSKRLIEDKTDPKQAKFARLASADTGLLERIISDQFDLQIKLKNHEVARIDSQSVQCRRLIRSISEKIKEQNSLLMNNNVVDEEELAIRLAMEESLKTSSEPSHQMTTRPKAPSNYIFEESVAKFIYCRRFDGEYVRLVCPGCHRETFKSWQGFVNHCILAHKIIFPSAEECHAKCGIVVPESQVPVDATCRKDKLVSNFYQLDAAGVDGQLDSIQEHDGPKSVGKDCDQIFESGESSTLRMTNEVPHTPYGLPSITLPPKESRFYTKKRLMVGSVSTMLAKENIPIDSRITHRWMVYIRPHSPEDTKLETYISKVRFFIHPSYSPNHIQDIESAPFMLVMSGWGEFPVRMQVHFHDSERNKPLDIIHPLTLERQTFGKQVQGEEKAIDIELDRQTEFVTAPKQEVEPTKIKTEPHAPNNGVMENSQDFIVNQEQVNSEESLFEASPKELPTTCKYCGLSCRYHPHMKEIRTLLDDPEYISVVLPSVNNNPYADLTDVHDPTKCNFKPMTKKGKLKRAFSTYSDYSCLDSQKEENLVDKKPSTDLIALLQSASTQSLWSCLTDQWNESTKENVVGLHALFRTSRLDIPTLGGILESQSLFGGMSSRTLVQAPSDSERLMVTTGLLMRAFMNDLVGEAVKLVREEQTVEREDWEIDSNMVRLRRDKLKQPQPPVDENTPEYPYTKTLTPFHLFKAIFARRHGSFDFLTNAYTECNNE